LKYRLTDAFGDDVKYEIIGEPKDEASAKTLAVQDRYQFQWWALSLVRARPYQGQKKGADEGVDGVIYYKDVDPDTPKKSTDPEDCRSGQKWEGYCQRHTGIESGCQEPERCDWCFYHTEPANRADA
jgi:site-specific DNA-methyltransferase (adenine-specific)